MKLVKKKLVRITTLPVSLKTLLKGQSKFMSDYYDVVGISSEGQELKDVVDVENIRPYIVRMTRTIAPLKDLYAVIRLFFIFKKEKPFIVHSHTPKAGIVSMLAAWMARVPIRIHTVAGMPLMETTGFKRHLLNNVEKLTYSCCTKIYPNSMGLHDFIVKEKFTKINKLKVLGNGSSNGIDIKYFDPLVLNENDTKILRKEIGIPEEDFTYIFIGRLVKDKGINELVEAFVQVQEQYTAVSLVLVGSLEEDLDPLLPKTHLSINTHPKIYTTGFINDVRPYFALAKALVFPSYREGFPNVVLQAGAMGLPSIVSNINGCNEIIKDGHNGIIIPVKDVLALKNAMKFILLNKKDRNNLTSNARSSITANFERNFVWDAILKEYKLLEKEFTFKKNR